MTIEGSNSVVIRAPRFCQPNRQGDKSLPQTAQRFTFTQVPVMVPMQWSQEVFCILNVVLFRCLTPKPVRGLCLKVQFVVWSRMLCREETVWCSLMESPMLEKPSPSSVSNRLSWPDFPSVCVSHIGVHQFIGKPIYRCRFP